MHLEERKVFSLMRRLWRRTLELLSHTLNGKHRLKSLMAGSGSECGPHQHNFKSFTTADDPVGVKEDGDFGILKERVEGIETQI